MAAAQTNTRVKGRIVLFHRYFDPSEVVRSVTSRNESSKLKGARKLSSIEMDLLMV